MIKKNRQINNAAMLSKTKKNLIISVQLIHSMLIAQVAPQVATLLISCQFSRNYILIIIPTHENAVFALVRVLEKC